MNYSMSYFILRVAVLIPSVITTFLLLADTYKPRGMELFPLVPLVFGVSYFFNTRMSKHIFNNIGLLGLNITMIIRYLVTPLFMWYEGYYVHLGASLNSHEYKIATFLMLLEIIVIMFVFRLFSEKYYEGINRDSTFNKSLKINTNHIFITSLFLMFSLLIIIRFPALLDRYSFVFTASEFTKSDLNIPFGSLLMTIAQFGLLLFALSILNFLYHRYLIKGAKSLIYISMFVVILTSSFIVGTSRFSIVVPMVAGMYLITRLYPSHKKNIYIFFGIVISFLVLLTTLIKQFGLNLLTKVNNSTNTGLDTVSSNLQLYFSGIHNVAVSVKARDLFKDSIDFSTIYSDLFSSVALLSEKFHSNFGGMRMFNYSFYNHTNSTDQILPMIGQGYLYFGFVFSPILVILFMWLMMFFDKKSREANTVFEVYIFAYASVRLGLFMMGNAINLTSFMINTVLLLLIIIRLNKKIVL
ncbi:hypothetical protein [Bacillus norwichensis]|uniref:Oligosaccharide repeat unit polymerase n=1 Tax=Bacillus norwichensis TaxID=2762217 RepID=A0ABR8VHK9_9BACI|nr:hypothetical protein [Bacillus norwichensis]MBD8004259.1 hypothetical protein [Bacillus norwichensis]